MRFLVDSLLRTFAPMANASRWWRAILVLLVVAVGYLALTPQPPPQIDTGWDKLNHMLAFAALAFAACLSWPLAPDQRRTLLLGLLFFGGAIEVLQLWVPGRASEWGDLLADATGIGFGTVLAAYVLSVTASATSSDSATR